MLPRHSGGIHLMPLQRNELKLAQLPYQILQGLLSCFGSLKRFTVDERVCHKDSGILLQITHTNTGTQNLLYFHFTNPLVSCQRSNEHYYGFIAGYLFSPTGNCIADISMCGWPKGKSGSGFKFFSVWSSKSYNQPGQVRNHSSNKVMEMKLICSSNMNIVPQVTNTNVCVNASASLGCRTFGLCRSPHFN